MAAVVDVQPSPLNHRIRWLACDRLLIATWATVTGAPLERGDDQLATEDAGAGRSPWCTRAQADAIWADGHSREIHAK